MVNDMSQTRIVIAKIILFALLVAVLVWQKDNTPVQLQGPTKQNVVSLMPFSDEWNLKDSEEAMVIFAYVPNEVSQEQLAQFEELAGNYGEHIKFATLNLTREHTSYSNSTYAQIYDLGETPAYIIRLKGQTSIDKRIGQLSEAEIASFIDTKVPKKTP